MRRSSLVWFFCLGLSLELGAAVVPASARGAEARCASITLQDDVFRSVERELEQLAEPDRSLDERLTAVRRAADYEGRRATEFLLRLLQDGADEQEALDRRLTQLNEELAPFLSGVEDIRVAVPKVKEEWEERKAIASKVGATATVLEATVTALAGRKDVDSRAALVKCATRARDWRMQCLLCEALAGLGDPASVPVLSKWMDSRDPRVRMMAAQAAGDLASAELLEPLAGLLDDPEWQVRAFTVGAFEQLALPRSVPHLIEALGEQSGRLRQDLAETLHAITGQELGRDARSWNLWWDEEGEAFLSQDPETRAAAVAAEQIPDVDGGLEYYGIATHSEKIIFILDVSDSMNDDTTETELPEDGQPNRVGNLSPKIQVAREHLCEAILDLSEGSEFNIILYNKYVRAWRPKMVKANKRNKNDAFQFVLGIQASDATNIFEALELAFQFAGSFARDKHYPSPVDTIFFLTDGKATEGRIQDPPEILTEIRRMNRLGKITIHTIGVGYLHDRDFLQALAAQNGGEYVYVQ